MEVISGRCWGGVGGHDLADAGPGYVLAVVDGHCEGYDRGQRFREGGSAGRGGFGALRYHRRCFREGPIRDARVIKLGRTQRDAFTHDRRDTKIADILTIRKREVFENRRARRCSEVFEERIG